MKSRMRMWITVVSLFSALVMLDGMAAQDNPSPQHESRHHQYKLIDMGTFGGPASFVPGLEVSINSRGTAIMQGDTATSDPFYPNCFQDCFVNHPGIWHDGVLTDLGVLHGSTTAASPPGSMTAT